MTLYPETRSLIFSHPDVSFDDRFPFRIGPALIRKHFPAHRHEYLEISLVIDGEGYQVINGKRHPLLPGTFFFLLPYQVHELFTNSNVPLRLYNCMFDMNLLFLNSTTAPGMESLLYDSGDWPSSIQTEGEELQSFHQLFEELMREFEGNCLWKHQVLQLKLLELLIRFDRLRRQSEPPANRQCRAWGDESVWQLVREVHVRFQEPLTLSKMAEQYHMSPSHLSEQFKRHTGMNFLRFLQDIRLRHACGLLVSSEMNELEIAAESGFGSFRSFSRIFREVKGLTPGAYRKQHKAGLSRAQGG